jgi:aerobic carbon-monoxide dehydrogenase small subunit
VNLRYALEVNGDRHQVEDAWLGESLLNVLRDRLDLPGSKNACEEGECGSCSVKVGGTLVCSCLVLAASAVDQPIETIEAQDHDGALSAVQAAFVDEGAVQCGFCTPGLVMAVDDLLDRDPDPSDLAIREAISGNLCRCTGYGRIIEAVRLAARARSQEP